MRALLSPPCSLLPPRPPPPRRPPRFPNLSSRFHVSGATKYRPWDSNAETFRSEKFDSGFRGAEAEDEDYEDEDEDEDLGLGFRSRGKKRRRWWSDGASSAIDDTPFGIFNQVVDSFWILKAFKSYGWALPPIIASLLLTTGPKAFLMALALPLGQSMISIAFEKLWGGGTETRQRRKTRARKRPFSGPGPSKAGRKKEEEVREDKKGYQSWEDGEIKNDNVNKTNPRNGSDFGGWDDLDRGRSSKKSSGTGGRNPKSAVEEGGKLGRKGRKGETPLLLRLLIAVFPFLGSWTKIL